MKTQNSHLLAITQKIYTDTVNFLLKGTRKKYHLADTEWSDGNVGDCWYNESTFKVEALDVDTTASGDKSFSVDSDMVSDYTFLEHIQAVYHEARHCEQSYTLWNKNNELGRDLACSYIARKNNDNFYFDHYSEIAYEVDAERDSIRKTYKYLKSKAKTLGINKKQSDILMTAYVNDKCEDGSYFLQCYHPDLYTDMKDVEDNLDGCYEMSQKTKQYEVPLEYRIRCRYGQKFDVMKEFLSVYPEYCEPMKLSFSMRDETKMMTGLMLRLYPEWKDNFKSLANEDLSLQTLFGVDLTDEQVSKMRKKLDNTNGLAELRQKRSEHSYCPPFHKVFC